MSRTPSPLALVPPPVEPADAATIAAIQRALRGRLAIAAVRAALRERGISWPPALEVVL